MFPLILLAVVVAALWPDDDEPKGKGKGEKAEEKPKIEAKPETAKA